MFSIKRIDHFVLTVRSLDAAVDFYTRILGMTLERFGEGRLALTFGEQKINLHLAGSEFVPHATSPTPGAADICFISEQPLSEVVKHLRTTRTPIEEGPVERTGAQGRLMSVYVRDPDGNLVEIAEAQG